MIAVHLVHDQHPDAAIVTSNSTCSLVKVGFTHSGLEWCHMSQKLHWIESLAADLLHVPHGDFTMMTSTMCRFTAVYLFYVNHLQFICG